MKLHVLIAKRTGKESYGYLTQNTARLSLKRKF